MDSHATLPTTSRHYWVAVIRIQSNKVLRVTPLLHAAAAAMEPGTQWGEGWTPEEAIRHAMSRTERDRQALGIKRRTGTTWGQATPEEIETLTSKPRRGRPPKQNPAA